MITVAKPLDREKKSEYRLEVVARDNAADVLNQKSKRTPVTIRLTDVNDNAPVFESLGPTVPSVAEIAGIGTSIFTVKADDPDEGELFIRGSSLVFTMSPVIVMFF